MLVILSRDQFITNIVDSLFYDLTKVYDVIILRSWRPQIQMLRYSLVSWDANNDHITVEYAQRGKDTITYLQRKKACKKQMMERLSKQWYEPVITHRYYNIQAFIGGRVVKLMKNGTWREKPTLFNPLYKMPVGQFSPFRLRDVFRHLGISNEESAHVIMPKRNTRGVYVKMFKKFTGTKFYDKGGKRSASNK